MGSEMCIRDSRNSVPELQTEISGKIMEQVRRYMPFIEIQDIKFSNPEEPSTSENGLFLLISYRIVPLDLISSVEIIEETN